MSKKFQNDLKLGLKSENTSVALLEKIFGEIIKTDRYNKYDFKCLHKPIKIELFNFFFKKRNASLRCRKA